MKDCWISGLSTVWLGDSFIGVTSLGLLIFTVFKCDGLHVRWVGRTERVFQGIVSLSRSRWAN
jgi:hypothetical protein